MVWLALDLRIDAKRLLWFNRRPVAFIAQDLGESKSSIDLSSLLIMTTVDLQWLEQGCLREK